MLPKFQQLWTRETEEEKEGKGEKTRKEIPRSKPRVGFGFVLETMGVRATFSSPLSLAAMG